MSFYNTSIFVIVQYCNPDLYQAPWLMIIFFIQAVGYQYLRRSTLFLRTETFILNTEHDTRKGLLELHFISFLPPR